MKSVSVGVLAHVDAGKTTCIESMLYQSGAIRSMGRVDHGDAFLDYDSQERDRGITIYSKVASLDTDSMHVDFIDTPGHVDFSSEMERALSVLDLAILVISAPEGVQAHTKTIWKCLEHYEIPTIVFVNKMDLPRPDKEELLGSIQKSLNSMIIDADSDDFMEQAALSEERLLDLFMEEQNLSRDDLQDVFVRRKLFPLYWGSALKNEGIDQLIKAISDWSMDHKWPSEFGARIYKVTTDEQNHTLAHCRITGGGLKVRDQIGEERIDRIFVPNGTRLTPVQSVSAGQVCVLAGLENPHAGQGLGKEADLDQPVLDTFLDYELLLPEGQDPLQAAGWLKTLALEDPTLHVHTDERTHAIHIQLMGEIQQDVLKKRIRDLAGIEIGFSQGHVLYQETIKEPVMGYGHFEPLRHYAEVHLRIEPLPRGSGIRIANACSRDNLSINWQSQIISAISHARPRGRLTGSPLSDVKITLINGKASNKHTSGGDFMQAVRRAIQQGLQKTELILQEPFCTFSLQIPSSSLSRALFDLDGRKADFQIVSQDDETSLLQGRGPLRLLSHYQQDVLAYTKGEGRFSMTSDGFDASPDQEQLVAESGYQSEAESRNPSSSIFCEHGSGVLVEWNQVEEHLHVPPVEEESSSASWGAISGRISMDAAKAAFEAAGGRNVSTRKQPKKVSKRVDLDLEKKTNVSPLHSLPTCLLVDGYNMIFSWKSLQNLPLSTAREQLISMLVNYQGYMGWALIIVFDGHHRKDGPEEKGNRGSASIVYTRTDESADQWIEKKVHELKGKFRCIVATSDALIQSSTLHAGALRLSSRELENRVSTVNQKALSHINKK